MFKPENARTVIKISGTDSEGFLQNLITQDIGRAKTGLAYAALLTPQGKYLADFFVFQREDAFYLDIATTLAPGLAQRLTMYRLRADVQIADAEMPVACGFGTAPDGALHDPRHDALGWRVYGTEAAEFFDWPALRVAHLIPETGVELHADSYILEAGFERLNGVDFKKGCYVGQEVTARMKHKTELRKGLAQLALTESIPENTPITAKDRAIGTVHTVSGLNAIAYLRFDRASQEMAAGPATATLA